MTYYLSGGNAKGIDIADVGLVGGVNLGILYDQRFYALRANGAELRFPFSSRPFTALVDISGDVDDGTLESYASALISHGCVQAVCRGEESARLATIFDDLAEKSGAAKSGSIFTSMSLDDEPLNEAIQYFVLPCGLAQTGLLLVIGDAGDFQNAVQGFSTAVGSVAENPGETAYADTDADLVCFVTS